MTLYGILCFGALLAVFERPWRASWRRGLQGCFASFSGNFACENYIGLELKGRPKWPQADFVFAWKFSKGSNKVCRLLGKRPFASLQFSLTILQDYSILSEIFFRIWKSTFLLSIPLPRKSRVKLFWPCKKLHRPFFEKLPKGQERDACKWLFPSLALAVSPNLIFCPRCQMPKVQNLVSPRLQRPKRPTFVAEFFLPSLSSFLSSSFLSFLFWPCHVGEKKTARIPIFAKANGGV